MFEVVNSPTARQEFRLLPLEVQAVFDRAITTLAGASDPIRAGEGWFVEELRHHREIFPQGLFSLHVGSVHRGLFIREGVALIFLAFGVHLATADVDAKLERLRREIERQERFI